MGLLTLCLLTSFLPQGPTSETTFSSRPATHPAAWLPAQSTLAVVLAPQVTSPLDGDALQHLRAQDPTGTVTILLDQVQRGLVAHDLSQQDVDDLLRGGLGIALHGWTTDGQPAITVVGRPRTRADAFRKALHKQGQPRRIDSVDCYELSAGGMKLLGGVFSQHVVLTTDPASLLRTVAATHTDDEQSLEHSLAYQQAVEDCGPTAPKTQLFVRPARLLEDLRGHETPLPIDVERVFTALDLHKVQTAMLGWSRDGAQDSFSGSLLAPGLHGTLAALLGSAARLDSVMAAIVPDSATAFGLCTIDLGALLKAGLQTIAAIDVDASAAIREAVDELRQGQGADATQVLFEGTNGRLAMMQLPSGNALAIGVDDPATWQSLTAALLAKSGRQVAARQIDGTAVHALEDPFGATTIVGTIGNWICIAQGEATFSAIVQQHAHAQVAPAIAAAMAAAPAQTSHLIADLRTRSTIAVTAREDRASLHTVSTSAPFRTVVGPADEAVVRALHLQETAGAQADLDQLEQLADCGDTTVAQRATWLLGKHPAKEKLPRLQRLARQSADAEVRLQAMVALLIAPLPASLETAADALDDSDLRVRVAGAQLLGKLRKPAGKEPLLAFLQRSRRTLEAAQDTSDVQAALVALHDLGAKEELLPATTTLDKATQNGVGQALAFYWQGVSPQFPVEQETTLLLAALDHSALLLRRYAIDRLAELNCTTAVPALEKRLANEGPELRPLVETTLTYLRRDKEEPRGDEYERAMANVQAMWAKSVATWKGLDDRGQVIALGAAGALLFVLCVGTMLVRRRRRQRLHDEQAAAIAAMTAPSDDYVEEYYEDGTDTPADEYYEGAEHDEQAYEDAGTYR